MLLKAPLLLCLLLISLVQAEQTNGNSSAFVIPTWQSGDVRLVNGPSLLEGYVLLYLNLLDGTADWGTVCYQVYSTLTNDAICKQLGYLRSNPNDLRRASGSSALGGYPVWLINDWRCNTTSSHILQCVTPYNINKTPYNPPPACSNSPLYIKCVETDPTLTPSDKQLRLFQNPLYTNVSSFGAVQLYFTANPGWGYITAGTFSAYPFTMAAANTVCRQLGYTDAVTYGRNITAPSPVDEPKTWFQGSNCSSSRVQQCFSCCYNPPPNYQPCGQQCDPSDAVFIQCTFDIGSLGVYKPITTCSDQSPGSDYCTGGSSGPDYWLAFTITIAVLLPFLFLSIIIIIIVSGCCFYKRLHDPERIRLLGNGEHRNDANGQQQNDVNGQQQNDVNGQQQNDVNGQQQNDVNGEQLRNDEDA